MTSHPQSSSPSPQAESALMQMLDAARRAGADAADCSYSEGRSLSVSVRHAAIEELDHSDGTHMGLRVWVGARVAHVSTSDLAPESCAALAQRAVEMARAAPEDPEVRLSKSGEYAETTPDLGLWSDIEMTPTDAEHLALRLEAAALSCEGVEAAEGATAGWSTSAITSASSNGFLQTFCRTHQYLSVLAIAHQDGIMERDYHSSSVVGAAALDEPEEVGQKAGSRAVKALGARKLETRANISAVFEPRMSASLLQHFSSAISGSAVVRGGTVLKDKMGEQIFRPEINIVDDPLRHAGLRSRPWDGEGIPAETQSFVESGCLRSWCLDLRTAARLGLDTTGHAQRASSGPSSPAPSNLYFAAGESSPEALIANIEEGIYVTGLLGGGANLITGDYSRGVKGFRISGGEICEPIHEMTLAGSLLEIFKNLRTANDLSFRHGIDAPTVRVDGLTLAGS